MRYFTFITLIFTTLFSVLQHEAYATPPADDKEENVDGERNLKILSWNIYMLPRMVVRKGKRARARAIVEELKKSDFDIIVFQEAFLPAARKIITAGLGATYIYQYGSANNSPSIKTNSGVWVISKVKMNVVKTIQFNDCATYDCWARKGAMLLEGTRNGKPFQLMGTHLQADEHQEIRYKQIEQIYNEILSE